ncbi:MAG: hypothetical protein KC657_29465 [Myxococcales bacterium]|nr:hypothetical protein [Myxococcales bacterium]
MSTRFATAFFLATLGAACGGATPEPTPGAVEMSVDVLAVSDPGKALVGVELATAIGPVGVTDARGRASVVLRGADGERVELRVSCPDGYASPAPLHVALRRVSGNSPAARFDARCSPLVRTVVVGVRARNGGSLPIVHLGQVIGRTDEDGVGHVLLRLKPNEPVALTLDTSARDSKLRPASPVLTFVPADRDDVVAIEQTFELTKSPRHPPRRTPRGPTRL